MLLFAGIITFLVLLLRKMKKYRSQQVSSMNHIFEISVIILITTGHLLFAFFQLVYSYEDYYRRINPFDLTEYTPLSFQQLPSFIFFYILNGLACFYVWRKGNRLPPLTFAFAICAMIYWSIICVFWSIQLLNHSDPEKYYDPFSGWIFMSIPLGFIFFNVNLFIRVIRSENPNHPHNQYKNKFLNYLNNKLIPSKKTSVWILILFCPFLLLILCVLMIFGQYPDSMIKVFTDTTTWTLSQKSHPPFLDHQGHYLCTVAACGSPQIVKPQRIGSRHGHPIIVNRQLSIANAFENLIETKFPRTHHFIRKNYDKYGYPLSKKITSRFGANLTYFAMKPLEWFFLVFIYFFSLKPEELINKQYGNN